MGRHVGGGWEKAVSEHLTLIAEPRSQTGKGPNRRLRNAGRVPAIVYGGGEEPMMCALVAKDVRKELRTNARFFSTVIDLDFGDLKVPVIAREAHTHPVSDEALHLDFIRATRGGTVTVSVPVVFLHEDRCPGLRKGGVLNVVRREVELVCPVDAIPDHVEADLGGLDINDTVRISDIKLPEGVRPGITDRDFMIATITGKGGAEEADAAEGTDEEE
jgi:large subunit ribosomal protein L25